MTRHRTRHRGIYYRNGSDDPNAKGVRRYIVWYADSDGKGRTETLPAGATEKDALERQAELRGKKARGERVAPSRVTVKEFAEAWLEEQRSTLAASTHANYTWAVEKWIVPKIGRRRLQEITVDDVARLAALMSKEGKSGATVRGVLAPLSRIFATAVRRGIVAVNPVKGLDKSERPKVNRRQMRILSSAEIEKLLPVVPDRYRALITFLTFTGLRISEALALRWEDVDFGRGIVTVGASKTEAGSGREVVLMPTLAGRLLEHRLESQFNRDDELVFPSARGTVQDRRNVLRRGLEEPAKDAGLEAVTLHQLRHTFASILIGQGMDVTFVAAQLGHADPAITLRIYAKLFDPVARRDEARTKLEAAFGAVV